MSEEVKTEEEPKKLTHDTLNKEVYEPYFVNLKDIADSLRVLYLADRVKRKDEIEKYIRSRVKGLGPSGVQMEKNQNVLIIKLKTFNKEDDRLYWLEFRVFLQP